LIEKGDDDDGDGDTVTSRITLNVLAGAHSGMSRTFSGVPNISLGRLPPQDTSLTFLSFPKDPYASRKHCVLESHPPRWKATNLSRKGIVVNGEKVLAEVWLSDGDRVRVGQTILAVSMDETVAPGPSRTVAFCHVCGRRNLLKNAKRSIQIICLDCLDDEAYNAQPFPKTTILGQIGRGGMGEVLLGRHKEQDELVAIKTMCSDPTRADDAQNINAFLREFQVGSQIRHEHAARVFVSGFISKFNLYYFLMEYVNGPDVSRAISERGRAFSIGKGIRIIRQVLQAVMHAHELGLVHRDIKPENIILGGDEDDPQAKLTDFGLMKDFVNVGMSFITQPGDGKGTPGFLPPEQLEDPRHVGPAADVYSLGATLQYMITGKPPFRLDTAYFANIILNPTPIPLRNVLPKAPVELENMILKCLAKKPEDRFQTAAELDDVLKSILATG
jgi:hypothetical protein